MFNFSFKQNIKKIFPPVLFVVVVFNLLAVLGLRCCTRAFSSCREQGLLFVVVRGLLIAVASFVAEHRLSARRLQ